MGHAFALGVRALELALVYLAVCVTAGAGVPLYRRLVIMWAEGRGWHDAGVVLRVRSRKGKAGLPHSHRRPPPPKPEPPLRALPPAVRMVPLEDVVPAAGHTLLSETISIDLARDADDG